jgi:hypothetical protein
MRMAVVSSPSMSFSILCTLAPSSRVGVMSHFPHAQALVAPERGRDRSCRRCSARTTQSKPQTSFTFEAFAFLDTDHDGVVSVEEISEQMKTVMRVEVPPDEIRSICKVSLSKNPMGLTMEDFKFLVRAHRFMFKSEFVLSTRPRLQVHWKPALGEGVVVQDEAAEESSGACGSLAAAGGSNKTRRVHSPVVFRQQRYRR